MKCKHCGEKIGRNAKFCRFCGQEIQKEKGKGPVLLIAGLMLAAIIVTAVVFIPRPVNGISGIEAKIRIKTGEQTTLHPMLKPKRHKEAEIKYKIEDSKIAKVEENGTITGLEPGVTELTVTAGGCSKTYDVKVLAKITEIKGIKKTISIQRGEKLILKPQLFPKKYQNEKIKFIMENQKVATVSEKGVITAKKTGESKLTIRAGGCELKTTVTVTAPPARKTSPQRPAAPKSGGNSARDYTYRTTPTQPPTASPPTTKHPQTTQPEEIDDGEWL